MLRVKDCLDRGEAVAMLADRTQGEGRAIAAPFLGAPARFPAGPLRTATILQVPVFLFFALYRGPRRYDIHFELLAERIDNAPAARAEALAAGVRRFAARLESFAREAPYNWFNFYDFWNDA
jgi:predicted LPLAT superfamily acyltransferase